MTCTPSGRPFGAPSAYLTYTYEGDGWGATFGGGGSWEGHAEKVPGPNREEQDFYQAGLNLSFGNFAIGGVFEYFNDLNNQGDIDASAWVAGGGISYSMDAWTVGAQYSHQDADDDGTADSEFTMDRVVLTGDYAMGPGINIDAMLGYTWVDTDPEFTVGGDDIDDYSAFEIGIGTRVRF